ncbi:DUF6586 family protein [Stutzerimonas azotifigens]|uniref:PasA protein n=1 Tax=Stutzerimonas azotifigens TaxID=291995 RepID=A0ABR5YXS9_9GAMM|nr:DUF6586 family protein [Stutzerimonas azotifigens]MBA1272719.1 PasA protein [Stutzerimonas azotifigens]
MAHELYTRTNQKMYFAGLSLESWRQGEQGGSMNAQGLIQAEREACLFHLYGALLGLCHEIAGYYRSADAGAPQAEAMLTPASLEAYPSPERGELVELANHPETWLGQLLAAYAALFQPPQVPAKVKVDPRTPLIEAVSMDAEEEAPGLSREEVEAWRQNLKRLALRFRESMTEW